jgi:ADP-glucose pyrophosphorylase
MTDRPGSIVACVANGSFWDAGTVPDYWRTSMAFIGHENGQGWYGRATDLAPSSLVTRSILWDDVHVGSGAVLDECIVTDHVRVPPGASYRRSILHVDGANRIVATPFQIE